MSIPQPPASPVRVRLPVGTLWFISALLWWGNCAWGAVAADTTTLAQHPTWRRLLHIPAGQTGSQITSAGFFLAPAGRHDAQAELEATLAAFDQPWPADPNQHPRCRFPARYFWLASHQVLTGYALQEPRCQRLQEWLRLDQLESVSLYLVSGYFGNPASTFGHALLRLNTHSGQRHGGQLDTSINFGAVVPERENTLLYILRGLSGQYPASFSNKPFYTHDLVYGHTEFRDMWEYRLRLTPEAQTLLVLHLAEVIGQTFDYYFLTQNCALRLAELVELATGQTVAAAPLNWYVPVELFHRLHQLDLLAQPPRFVPAAERVMLHEFARLPPAQREQVNRLIDTQLATLEGELAQTPAAQRLDVLDTLLAYQEYRLVAAEPEPPQPLRRDKDRVLLQRLRQPARSRPPSRPEELPSPALGHAPMLTEFSLWHLPSGPPGRTQGLGLRWAPFGYVSGGFHGLGSSEMAVVDSQISADADHGLWLERLDWVRVRKLALLPAAMSGVDGWSWQLRLGQERLPLCPPGAATGAGSRFGCEHHPSSGLTPLRGVASFGMGRAWQTPAGVWFVMLDGRLQTPHAQIQPTPLLGWDQPLGRWRWGAELSHGLLPDSPWQFNSRLSYRLHPDQALQLRWDHQSGHRFVAALQQFW